MVMSVGATPLNSGIYHLAAQDFVLIDEGFVADGNGVVIISTMPCQADQTNSSNIPTYPSFPSNATLQNIESSKRSTQQY
jgi:hypothetical protein